MTQGQNWLLTAEQTNFQHKVHDFAQNVVAPLAEKIDRNNCFPREIWPKIGEAKLFGITADKRYGGTEQGYLIHALALEEISRASGAVGLSYAAQSNLCINQLQLFASEAQKTRYLPKLISGEWLGALAMSEKDAGSDVLSMQLRAEEKTDHFILNGHKMWITNGPTADILLVYAKTNPEAGPHGISCFIIEKEFDGFQTKEKLNKLGMRGSDTGELLFKNCIVPKENLLGELNGGLGILMGGLDFERAVIAAGPLGLIQASCDLVIPYVKKRHQFKKPVGSFQMIQHKLADLYTALHATRCYVYTTAIACDAKKVTTEQAASAYLFASENATKSALETVQCLGGYGYLNECSAGRLLRDAKLYEIGAGTTEIRRLVIARELLR